MSDMVRHGARRVDMGQIARESQVIQHIGPNDEISETCIRSEEFLSSATRNAKSALDVISRMHESENLKDHHLLTALKKYVEDACEAIKVVDSTLERENSSLQSLLIEIPNETSEDEASWRNLVARRDVIAHRLLTVDDDKVYREAVRDFASLHQLLSRVYFVPVKTDIASGTGFSPLLRTEVLHNLTPSVHGATPQIGESLIFICEDKVEGFLSFRLGRSEENKILVSSSKAPLSISFSLQALDIPDNPIQE